MRFIIDPFAPDLRDWPEKLMNFRVVNIPDPGSGPALWCDVCERFDYNVVDNQLLSYIRAANDHEHVSSVRT